MHERLALVALTTACAAAHASLAGQTRPPDYPQWRGLLRDGGASGFVEPASWPDALARRWRVEVGDGYSTPLVVGATVYVFSRERGGEVLRALDASSGAERWQTSYPAPYTPSSPTAAHGPGPKATPLFHEGKVFTLGVSGIVAAFDAARGTLLWRSAAPAEPPFFSAAASPVGDAGVVITHPGNYEPLTAFDAATGAVRWTSGPGGSFMAPATATLQRVSQVVSATQGGVIGVSPSNGRLLWTYPWAGGAQGGIMPIVHDGTVVVSANTQGVLAIRPTLEGGSWTVEKVWETRYAEMYLSHPVVVGGTLFGFSRLAGGQ
jgi:outer membrane protein assembly factor BamB